MVLIFVTSCFSDDYNFYYYGASECTVLVKSRSDGASIRRLNQVKIWRLYNVYLILFNVYLTASVQRLLNVVQRLLNGVCTTST